MKVFIHMLSPHLHRCVSTHRFRRLSPTSIIYESTSCFAVFPPSHRRISHMLSQSRHSQATDCFLLPSCLSVFSNPCGVQMFVAIPLFLSSLPWFLSAVDRCPHHCYTIYSLHSHTYKTCRIRTLALSSSQVLSSITTARLYD